MFSGSFLQWLTWKFSTFSNTNGSKISNNTDQIGSRTLDLSEILRSCWLHFTTRAMEGSSYSVHVSEVLAKQWQHGIKHCASTYGKSTTTPPVLHQHCHKTQRRSMASHHTLAPGLALGKDGEPKSWLFLSSNTHLPTTHCVYCKC